MKFKVGRGRTTDWKIVNHGLAGCNMKNWRMSRKGFSLAEAVLATVLLGIAAAGVMLPFSAGAAAQAQGGARTLGAKLASDLMEQIVSKPFHDPDGSAYYYNLGADEGEATVADFDNIDDFHGYTEALGQVKDAALALFSNTKYAKFSRRVVCAYVSVSPQDGTYTANFIRITVRVDYDGDEVATLNRLVSE